MASGYLALSRQAVDVLKDISIQSEVWHAQVDAQEVSITIGRRWRSSLFWAASIA